jgi:hypothetical protein
MVSDFGPAALETAARHPGLAPSLASRLGGEGLDVARSLSTDQAILLSRHADSLASLPAAERSAFLSFIRSSPARSLAWIEKHPRLLLAGSGTAAVIAARKEIFGDGEHRGFLERAGSALSSTFQQPANLVAGGLAAAVLAAAALTAVALVAVALSAAALAVAALAADWNKEAVLGWRYTAAQLAKLGAPSAGARPEKI